MKMVNRLVDIDEGDVLLDDTSVRALDATQLRRHIGYVIQQVGLPAHDGGRERGCRAAAARLAEAADPSASTSSST